jgi:hypothetical protein
VCGGGGGRRRRRRRRHGRRRQLSVGAAHRRVGSGGRRRKHTVGRCSGSSRRLPPSVTRPITPPVLRARQRPRSERRVRIAARFAEIIAPTVYPQHPIRPILGEAPRCRAELFMHVQVHETVHPAFVPGACGFQDSQQGGLHRRTLARSLARLAVGEAVRACRRNHCVDQLIILAGGRRRARRNVLAGETSPDKTQASFARIERIQQLHRPVCCRPVHLSVGAARENLDPCAK